MVGLLNICPLEQIKLNSFMEIKISIKNDSKTSKYRTKKLSQPLDEY